MNSPISQRLREAFSLRSCYREVFADNRASQTVLRHLMRSCGVTRSCFSAGDPTETAYRNGQRDVVLSILRYVSANDDDLRKLIEQAYKQETENLSP